MNRIFYAQTGSKARRAITRLLLLGFACLCTYWLTGGFPPTNWQLLALALLTFRVNLTTYGNAFLLPFLILCVQSVLLIIVWSWLLVLLARDIVALLNTSTETGTEAAIPLASLSDSLSMPALPPVNKPPKETWSVRAQMGTMTLGKTGPLSSLRRGIPAPPDDHLLADTSSASSVSGSPNKAIGAIRNSSDPFAVQPGILTIFDDPDALNGSPLQPEQSAPQQFVFGNPFEGPLPEVFEYDTDLKQSLAEFHQQSNASALSRQQKAKL